MISSSGACRQFGSAHVTFRQIKRVFSGAIEYDSGFNLYADLLCPEPGPDLFRKKFPWFTGMHEIFVDLGRDARILVDQSRVELYLKNFRARTISNGTHDGRFNGLSFQDYRHSFRRALKG